MQWRFVRHTFRDFSRNPVALFNHRADFPIGRWRGLRVERGALRGYLDLAPEGTSARIDEIRKLVAAGILRAVSVGFTPIESHPRGANVRGVVFVKQALVETSLVSIPANPNALAVAKSLKISAGTRELVFVQRSKQTMRPKDGELRSEFMKRCQAAGHTTTTCASLWAMPRPPAGPMQGDKKAKLEAEVLKLQRRWLTQLEDLASAREFLQTLSLYDPKAVFESQRDGLKWLRQAEAKVRTFDILLRVAEDQLREFERRGGRK